MKKGFTLVELLAVIVILAFIAMISTIAVGSIIKDSRTKLSQMQTKKIEEAARAFYIKEGINNDITCVELSDLIQKGYIEEDIVKNPATSEEMTGSVKISYDSNQYSYTYQSDTCIKKEVNEYGEFVYENLFCEEGSFVYGDADGDGTVNNRDLGLLGDYLFGRVYLSKNEICALDLNIDKIIGVFDIQILQHLINGHDITIPYVEEMGTTYSISYNLNGGYLHNFERVFSKFSYILPHPTKDGYEFLGWTGSNGNTPELNVTIPSGATGNLEYTAHWEKIS